MLLAGPAMADARRAPGDRKTALVMEDDAPIRGLIGELLGAEGYEVLEAADGRQGLRLAREHRPSVILLDLDLPPTSGLAVLEELRSAAATRHIPVVVVSGYAGEEREANRLGASGFLGKPFDVEVLLAHVARVAAVA